MGEGVHVPRGVPNYVAYYVVPNYVPTVGLSSVSCSVLVGLSRCRCPTVVGLPSSRGPTIVVRWGPKARLEEYPESAAQGSSGYPASVAQCSSGYPARGAQPSSCVGAPKPDDRRLSWGAYRQRSTTPEGVTALAWASCVGAPKHDQHTTFRCHPDVRFNTMTQLSVGVTTKSCVFVVRWGPKARRLSLHNRPLKRRAT